MNKADTNELTEYWHRETRYVNDKVDEAFKEAQDHAYALGLKRGHGDYSDLVRAAEQVRAELYDSVATHGTAGGFLHQLADDLNDALRKLGAGGTATEGHNALAQGPGGFSPGPAGAMGSATLVDKGDSR